MAAFRAGLRAALAGAMVLPVAGGMLLLAAGALLLLAGAPAAAEGPAAGCPRVRVPPLDLPVLRAAILGGGPVTIVAFGSSSTEGSGASAPERTYPARLEAMLRARWPRAGIRVINRGVGGETVEDMMRRIDEDVLARDPALVIWQTGANDALHGIDPERFETLLDAGVRRIVARGGDVILMDNQIAPSIQKMARNAAYDAAIAEEAARRHVALFSRTALMRAWFAADPTPGAMIGPDGLHHTDRGYACLADALGRAIIGAVTRPKLVAGAAR